MFQALVQRQNKLRNCGMCLVHIWRVGAIPFGEALYWKNMTYLNGKRYSIDSTYSTWGCRVISRFKRLFGFPLSRGGPHFILYLEWLGRFSFVIRFNIMEMFVRNFGFATFLQCKLKLYQLLGYPIISPLTRFHGVVPSKPFLCF